MPLPERPESRRLSDIRKDLASWAECISRAFTAYGAGRSDIFQVSYGYGLFTGGLGAHAGAENIGASVIPMSSGNTEKQITLMHDFGSTVLCCTPSYALYLADAIKDSGLPREEFQLKSVRSVRNPGRKICVMKLKRNWESKHTIFMG